MPALKRYGPTVFSRIEEGNTVEQDETRYLGSVQYVDTPYGTQRAVVSVTVRVLPGAAGAQYELVFGSFADDGGDGANNTLVTEFASVIVPGSALPDITRVFHTSFALPAGQQSIGVFLRNANADPVDALLEAAAVSVSA